MYRAFSKNTIIDTVDTDVLKTILPTEEEDDEVQMEVPNGNTHRRQFEK
jgi:hypothetical protein